MRVAFCIQKLQILLVVNDRKLSMLSGVDRNTLIDYKQARKIPTDNDIIKLARGLMNGQKRENCIWDLEFILFVLFEFKDYDLDGGTVENDETQRPEMSELFSILYDTND